MVKSGYHSRPPEADKVPSGLFFRSIYCIKKECHLAPSELIILFFQPFFKPFLPVYGLFKPNNIFLASSKSETGYFFVKKTLLFKRVFGIFFRIRLSLP